MKNVRVFDDLDLIKVIFFVSSKKFTRLRHYCRFNLIKMLMIINSTNSSDFHRNLNVLIF